MGMKTEIKISGNRERNRTDDGEMERLAQAVQATCRGGPKYYVAEVLAVLHGGGRRYGLGLVIS